MGSGLASKAMRSRKGLGIDTSVFRYDIWKVPLNGRQSGLNPEGTERCGVRFVNLPPWACSAAVLGLPLFGEHGRERNRNVEHYGERSREGPDARLLSGSTFGLLVRVQRSPQRVAGVRR